MLNLDTDVIQRAFTRGWHLVYITKILKLEKHTTYEHADRFTDYCHRQFRTKQFVCSNQQSKKLVLGKFLACTRHFRMASFPLLGALLAIPAGSTLTELWSSGGALLAIIYGILWGVGGLTFGLSMRYLGVALGQSISLGTCAAFGTLFPALFGGTDLFHGEGLMLLIGVCITLAGIAIIGYAGSLRSKNMSEEEKKAAVKDFALTKGLLVALLAGIMSACFALGLDAGTPIKEAALEKEQMHCMQDSPSFFW